MPKVLRFLSTIVIFAVLSAGYYSLFYTISLSKIGTAEKYMMNSGLQVIEAGFNKRIKQMEMLANDWSYWDDCYLFMSGANETFPESELSDETLLNMGVNMILFYDSSGHLIHKKTVSLSERQEVTIPGELLDENSNDSLKPMIAAASKDLETKKGFLHTPSGNLIFGMAPILQSDGNGPSRGTILMGRFINEEDVEMIRAGVGLELSIYDYVNVPSNLDQQLKKDGTFYQRLRDTLVAYRTVNDNFNDPAFYMEFHYPKIVFDSWCFLARIFAAIAAGGTLLAGSIFIKACYRKPDKSPIA